MVDLSMFGDVVNGKLCEYHCWTDADQLKAGDMVTIVNSNCEFDFDCVTGTFEPNLYYCYIADLQIISVDLSGYVPAKSNNGGGYGFALCKVLKVHGKEY